MEAAPPVPFASSAGAVAEEEVREREPVPTTARFQSTLRLLRLSLLVAAAASVLALLAPGRARGLLLLFVLGETLVVTFALTDRARGIAAEIDDARAGAVEAGSTAQRSAEFRQALVSTLAHDVRTPIQVIQGTLHLLMSDGSSLDADTSRNLLQAADRQAARLSALTSDLLDLARLERGRLELEQRDVDVADAIGAALRYTDPDDQFEVRVPPGLVARADERRLEQVLVNLLTNALRHGRAPFTISAAAHPEGVAIEVTDAGPGVPTRLRGHLFEPFQTGGGPEAVGLGLWIARGLAIAQGGTLDYRDNRPSGAWFTVVLPGSPSELAGDHGR